MSARLAGKPQWHKDNDQTFSAMVVEAAPLSGSMRPVWRLVRYQLHLALEGVRRKPGLSLTIVVVLSLAGGMWTFAVVRYLRHHGPYPDLSPTLHQVELSHGEAPLPVRGQGSTHTTAGWATHTRVSFPEYQRLAASGVPTRHTASFRSRLLVSPPAGAADPSAARTRLAHARFVNSPFFSMFALPLGSGRAFTGAEEAAGAAVVVIGERLDRALFPGGGGLGQTLLVEGRHFRVVGVIAGDQPFRPTWDIAMLDRDQDALYLPFPWFRRLRARPDSVVHQSPVGPGYEDLLRSQALFVAYWLELPTAEARAAYVQHLDRQFSGPDGPRYRLRSYQQWKREFTPQPTRVAFLSALGGLLLLAGGFSATRLLLTKEVTRRRELGVRRALGASRWALFTTQMLEAALLSLVAAAVGVVLALPLLALFNRVVADADIPARLSGASVALGAGMVVVIGLAAALLPAWRVSRTPPGLASGR
jgi:putative ABC transport system permease protein